MIIHTDPNIPAIFLRNHLHAFHPIAMIAFVILTGHRESVAEFQLTIEIVINKNVKHASPFQNRYIDYFFLVIFVPGNTFNRIIQAIAYYCVKIDHINDVHMFCMDIARKTDALSCTYKAFFC